MMPRLEDLPEDQAQVQEMVSFELDTAPEYVREALKHARTIMTAIVPKGALDDAHSVDLWVVLAGQFGVDAATWLAEHNYLRPDLMVLVAIGKVHYVTALKRSDARP